MKIKKLAERKLSRASNMKNIKIQNSADLIELSTDLTDLSISFKKIDRFLKSYWAILTH
jgi:hypothetical protein